MVRCVQVNGHTVATVQAAQDPTITRARGQHCLAALASVTALCTTCTHAISDSNRNEKQARAQQRFAHSNKSCNKRSTSRAKDPVLVLFRRFSWRPSDDLVRVSERIQAVHKPLHTYKHAHKNKYTLTHTCNTQTSPHAQTCSTHTQAHTHIHTRAHAR